MTHHSYPMNWTVVPMIFGHLNQMNHENEPNFWKWSLWNSIGHCYHVNFENEVDTVGMSVDICNRSYFHHSVNVLVSAVLYAVDGVLHDTIYASGKFEKIQLIH